MSRPPIYIYLAGPIFGATGAEANDWRKDMTARLASHNIVGISPLRCEPIVGERYDTQYADPCFGTAKAIVSKNFLDLVKCDFTLVYMPKPPAVDELAAVLADMRTANPVDGYLTEAIATLERIAVMSPQRSIGTIGELSWCKALAKPVAVVSDDPLVKRHPFFSEQAGWMLDTLDEAERLIVGLYSDYARD
jgi:hypothetical protein